TNWLVNLKGARVSRRAPARAGTPGTSRVNPGRAYTGDLMKIVIAGGSGFLGRPLAAALAADGHDIVTLSRGAAAKGAQALARAVAWTPDGNIGPWAAEIDGAGAVVNLAGESIAGKRWTAEQKRRILDSRVLATRSLVAAIAG